MLRENEKVDMLLIYGESQKKSAVRLICPYSPKTCLYSRGNGLRRSVTNAYKLTQHISVDTKGIHGNAGDDLTPSQIKGFDFLRDPRLNKGLAFTLEERQALGIHGLQPPRYKTMEEQVALCKISVERYHEDLNKYLYLTELSDRNEKLFYRLLSENVESLLPIVYTPTVGLACQKFGLIYRRPRGLFITINDRHHCYDILKNWPEPNVRAICVTDGERILGLGDLGASGMGIPVGKLSLYTALGGIKPHQCLPILLDVGTNNQALLEDPTYIGLRQKRVTGQEYEDFCDEFMHAVVDRYGQSTLIQFEDFASHNAFRFLEKYRDQYCVFNDDIQGTASVIVAGLLACKHITKKKIVDNKYLFVGAGGAALGIANLLVSALQSEGLSMAEARERIWVIDYNGLITKSRDDLTEHQTVFAKDFKNLKGVKDVVEAIKPTAIIGASATAGLFTPEVLQLMAANNERPIIFALSNPTSKAECTAEEAYRNTQGRCVFASGSPFAPVEYEGVMYKPSQGNNAYIFPGIALGIISTSMYHIKDEIFLIAAQVLADLVTEDSFKMGSIYPPIKEIRSVSLAIATKICEYAYSKGVASVYPEPKDKRKYVESTLYKFNYTNSLPVSYGWPKPAEVHIKPLDPAEVVRCQRPVFKVSAMKLINVQTVALKRPCSSGSVQMDHSHTRMILCRAYYV
ncbi:hypothetical protein FQR65_LT09512 [Abscondita terminalis]|nr:hypothetical protein FQR65_LT09512 [Abscondita terminalis]